MKDIAYRWWLLRLWFRERPDKLAWWIVHLLPRKLVYLAVIRLWAWVSVYRYPTTQITAITIDQALDAWEKRKLVKVTVINIGVNEDA